MNKTWKLIIVLSTTLAVLAGNPFGDRIEACQAFALASAGTQDEDEEEEDGDSGVGRYMGGAMLKTDPELASLLKKADEYKKDGNYQVASKYWQAVLERSGDTLYSDDGETYFAMTEKVESVLAELPEDGLRSYRISADAKAREIMAQAKGEFDVETLSKIVKTYFISSLGDDAAYQLAGIFLDQYDFVAATRLLRKIVDQYPQPSVSLSDVWLKLAVAYTYLGDLEMAQTALEESAKASAADSQTLEAVQNLVDQAPKLEDRTASARDWTMRMGTARRFGVMSPLPEDFLQGDLVSDWQFFMPPEQLFDNDTSKGRVFIGADAYSELAENSVKQKESKMIESWRSYGWRPSGHLLFQGDNVVFKTGGDFVVWDRNPGEEYKWRPLWFNFYVEDEGSRTLRQMITAYGGGTRKRSQPNEPSHILYFSDQIQHSYSIYRNSLYNIEGEIYELGTTPSAAKTANAGYRWGQMPRRNRINALTSYDMATGKLKWRQPPPKELKQPAESDETSDSEEVLDPFDSVGFMSAPVGVGDLVLVPVSQAGSMFMYAINAETGELAWKSYLCDEPSGGSQPFSPMELTVDGSSAYISCGTGVVFALDPLTGTIQYARRYERTGKDDPSLQGVGISGTMIMDGWETDMVIPMGNILLLFGSDYDNVWAIDRQSAKFLWKTDNRPFGNKFDYLIGIYGDKIYLGGTNSIAAISIRAQGRWEWVEEFRDEKSLGRAMLTENGLYVPIEDSIAHYSLEGKNGQGEQLARVGVRTGSGAPVGNLYSDGEKIWVVGGNRLYKLAAAPPEPEQPETDEDADDEDADKDDADEDADDEDADKDDSDDDSRQQESLNQK